jgi:hypothetical protein
MSSLLAVWLPESEPAEVTVSSWRPCVESEVVASLLSAAELMAPVFVGALLVASLAVETPARGAVLVVATTAPAPAVTPSVSEERCGLLWP